MRRQLLVSRGWPQATLLVFVVGFAILGALAWRTYTASAPIPAKVVDPQCRVLFEGDDSLAGQETFLTRGLINYGSVLGHGLPIVSTTRSERRSPRTTGTPR